MQRSRCKQYIKQFFLKKIREEIKRKLTKEEAGKDFSVDEYGMLAFT